MLVCVEADCSNGLAKVRGMRSLFDQLGQPTDYAASVGAIEEEARALEQSAGWFRAFDPDCCALAAVGTRAETLSLQMAASRGVAAPPSVNESGAADAFASAGKWVVVGLVALAAIVVLREVKP